MEKGFRGQVQELGMRRWRGQRASADDGGSLASLPRCGHARPARGLTVTPSRCVGPGRIRTLFQPWGRFGRLDGSANCGGFLAAWQAGNGTYVRHHDGRDSDKNMRGFFLDIVLLTASLSTSHGLDGRRWRDDLGRRGRVGCSVPRDGRAFLRVC